MSKNMIKNAIATVITMGVTGGISVASADTTMTSTTPAATTGGATVTVNMPQANMEKCYGVSKAGQNDCKTAGHDCSTKATADASKSEFVSVPTGLCNKLVNGSMTPPANS